MTFRVGQTIECVDARYSGGRLTEGRCYEVRRIWDSSPVVMDSGGYEAPWEPNRFRAVSEPSLIDPDKWEHRGTAVASGKYGHAPSAEVLAMWCLVNSAAVLLGVLVGALPSKPARTWDDYQLHSVWLDTDGTAWTVDGLSNEKVGVFTLGASCWFTPDEMADWTCLALPVTP